MTDFQEDCSSDQSAQLTGSEVNAEKLPNILQTEPPDEEEDGGDMGETDDRETQEAGAECRGQD